MANSSILFRRGIIVREGLAEHALMSSEKGERKLRPNRMQTKGPIYCGAFILRGTHTAWSTSVHDIGDRMPGRALHGNPFAGSDACHEEQGGVGDPVAVFLTID